MIDVVYAYFYLSIYIIYIYNRSVTYWSNNESYGQIFTFIA